MAGTEKHVIQTATFAPVSCRRLAMDFRKSFTWLYAPSEETATSEDGDFIWQNYEWYEKNRQTRKDYQ